MIERLKWLTKVRRLGLTYAEKTGLRLAWSASGIEFLTNSCSVSIIMRASSLSSSEDAYIAAFYNDEAEPRYKFRMHTGENICTLLQSEKPQFVKIRLLKLTEEQYGNVWLQSLASDGPLWRSEPAKHNLLFIGDSITAGYGVNGQDGELFQTQTEDVTKAYAYKTAQLLDADCTIVAYSGNGVLSHWIPDTATKPATQALMPAIFPYCELKEMYQEQKQLADSTEDKLLHGAETELLKAGRFALKANVSQAFYAGQEAVVRGENLSERHYTTVSENFSEPKLHNEHLAKVANTENTMTKTLDKALATKQTELSLLEQRSLKQRQSNCVTSTSEKQSSPELVNKLNDKALPDFIVCNLGTNDASYTRGLAEREAKFVEKYLNFVTKLKQIFPEAAIVLAYGVMEQSLCEAVEEVAQRSAVGYLPLPLQNREAGLGVAGHPSAKTQQQMAELIAEHIAGLW